KDAIADWALSLVNPGGKRVSRMHVAISLPTIFYGRFRNQSAALVQCFHHKSCWSCTRLHVTTDRETHRSITDALAAVPGRLLPSFLLSVCHALDVPRDFFRGACRRRRCSRPKSARETDRHSTH